MVHEFKTTSYVAYRLDCELQSTAMKELIVAADSMGHPTLVHCGGRARAHWSPGRREIGGYDNRRSHAEKRETHL